MTTLIGDFYVILRKEEQYQALLVDAIVSSYGCGLYFAPARIDAKEHRSCADGRPSTRHLHGRTARAARCATVKVPAESAGAVAR